MKNKIILQIFLATIISSILVVPFYVNAALWGLGGSDPTSQGSNPATSQGFNPPTSQGYNAGGQTIDNPLGNGGPSDLWSFIAAILETVTKIGASVVVFFVIYSGFLFVTAQGNEEKLKKAKQAFLYTMIGAAILLGAQLIAEVIKGTITNLGK